MRDDRTVFLFVFATDRPLHLDPLDIESHKVGCQFGAIASLQPAKATVNEDKALANASQASYKNAPLNFCSRRAKSLLSICRPIELMKELTHAIEWVAHTTRSDEDLAKRQSTLEHPEFLVLSNNQCLPLCNGLLKASTEC